MASLQCYPDQSNYIKPVGTTTTATHTYFKDTYEQDSGKNTTYGAITPSHGWYGTTHGYNNTPTHGHHNNNAGYDHHITSATHGHHNSNAGYGHHITSATDGHHNNTTEHGHHNNAIAAHGHHNGHGISKTHSHSEYSHVKPVHGRCHRKVKKVGCSDYTSDSCSDSDSDRD